MTIQTFSANATVGTAYTSTGATAVTFMSFCNYANVAITANVYVVPSGNAVGNNTVILQNLPLTPGDTYQLYAGAEKLLLNTGDTIQVQANIANALNVVTSYTTI
jgi:hypothetical protein